jgi:hypothetical protein
VAPNYLAVARITTEEGGGPADSEVGRRRLQKEEGEESDAGAGGPAWSAWMLTHCSGSCACADPVRELRLRWERRERGREE